MWKGVAIAGIWIGAAAMSYFFKAIEVPICAALATAAVALDQVLLEMAR